MVIVPTVEFPPLTLSTDQVTAVFVVPVTVAINGIFVLTGTLAVDWFNVTLTTGGGGGVVDELFELEQPTSVKVIDRARLEPENFLLKALDFVAFINCLQLSASICIDESRCRCQARGASCRRI